MIEVEPTERAEGTGAGRSRLRPGLAALVIGMISLAVLLKLGAPQQRPLAPEDLAESFMTAWASGDGEAVAAMLGAEGFEGFSLWNGDMIQIEPEVLPALHGWYRAVAWDYHNQGCGLLRVLVSCHYTFENVLTRSQGKITGSRGDGGATGSFLFLIEDGEIRRVWDDVVWHTAGTEVWAMFGEWVADNHPGDFARMYAPDRAYPGEGSPDGRNPRLDQASKALWERYTYQFTELVASPRLLVEWEPAQTEKWQGARLKP